MNSISPCPVPDSTADICAASQLVLLERECRDLGFWERMRDCFHPDSRVKISWFEGTGDEFVDRSIDMAQRGVLARHRLGPPLVRLAGHRGIVTLSAIVDVADTISKVDVNLSTHARFIFRTEKRNATWRIRFFDSIYMRDELTSAIPGQALAIAPNDIQAFRASYRMLSYLLSMKGYTINMNLPGDDQPATVAALHQEVYAWAGIDP